MKTEVKHILSYWNNIKNYERRYLAIWVAIGILMLFTEIGGRLEIFQKGWTILPYGIGIIILIFIYFSARLAKNGKDNYVIKEVPISEVEYKKIVGLNAQSILFLVSTGNIYKYLLGWTPIWSLVVLTVLWLSLFFVGNLKVLNEVFSAQPIGHKISQPEISIEKLVHVFVIGFSLIMVIIAFAAYHNLDLK